MSKDIQSVFSSVDVEMQHFRTEFDRLVSSDVKYLKLILKYLFKQRGKQIRPLFVILSAGACGNINEMTYRAAALIELLHTATLVHDDVVDEADQRRGMFTVNALWKNKTAVLLGDYLLATGLLTALEHDYFQLLKYVSRATRKMSEGELWQIQKLRSGKADEESYYKIIEYKTAVLFAASFQCGAYTAGAGDEAIEVFFEAGLLAGMAFQIKDDLLDFSENETGKKAFTDLKEKKLTLPIIHALNNSDFTERLKYKKIIKNIKSGRKTPDSVLEWLYAKGSLEYTAAKMNEFARNAIAKLEQLPDNKHRDLLVKTINFITERNY